MDKRILILKLELVAITALFLSGVLYAVPAYILSSTGSSMVSPNSAALIVLVVTMEIGLMPVSIIGVPIYLYLKSTNKNTWFYVLGLGISPGILAILFSASLDLIICSLISGVLVSSVTHLYDKYYL